MGGINLVITGGVTWIISVAWATYPEGTGSREGYEDDVGGWWGHFRYVEPYSRASQNQK